MSSIYFGSICVYSTTQFLLSITNIGLVIDEQLQLNTRPDITRLLSADPFTSAVSASAEVILQLKFCHSWFNAKKLSINLTKLKKHFFDSQASQCFRQK